jgi:hypothetical protein
VADVSVVRRSDPRRRDPRRRDPRRRDPRLGGRFVPRGEKLQARVPPHGRTHVVGNQEQRICRPAAGIWQIDGVYDKAWARNEALCRGAAMSRGDPVAAEPTASRCAAPRQAPMNRQRFDAGGLFR